MHKKCIRPTLRRSISPNKGCQFKIRKNKFKLRRFFPSLKLANAKGRKFMHSGYAINTLDTSIHPSLNILGPRENITNL